MNFIGETPGREIHVELKYCERCGGLFLRLLGTDGVHCPSCQKQVASLLNPGPPPASKLRRRKAQVKGSRGRKQVPPQIEIVECVIAFEVLA